jgi:hypothetical protein
VGRAASESLGLLLPRAGGAADARERQLALALLLTLMRRCGALDADAAADALPTLLAALGDENKVRACVAAGVLGGGGRRAAGGGGL